MRTGREWDAAGTRLAIGMGIDMLQPRLAPVGSKGVWRAKFPHGIATRKTTSEYTQTCRVERQWFGPRSPRPGTSHGGGRPVRRTHCFSEHQDMRRVPVARLIAVIIAVTTVGCSKPQPSPPAKPLAATPPAATPAQPVAEARLRGTCAELAAKPPTRPGRPRTRDHDHHGSLQNAMQRKRNVVRRTSQAASRRTSQADCTPKTASSA